MNTENQTAPRMLAALQDALEEINAWRRKFHPNEWPDKPVVHTATRNKVQSAIAEATGAPTATAEYEDGASRFPTVGPDGRTLAGGECVTRGEIDAGLVDHETTATPVADRGNTFGDRQANDDILPGNTPCSASAQILHYDKGEAPTASEAPPEPEIDTIAEPVAGMWRARLVTPNFTFEAFGLDIASARRALDQGLTRHARQYGLDPGRWRAVADSIEVSFVRAGAAYCDGELIRERGARD